MADAPRKRRWPFYLAVLAALLAFGAWWVDRQLEPTRLTATVLARAGAALGLELTIDGTPEYAPRPEPRLVLPKLTVRQPGAAAPLLTAARAEISLPWDTLTGGGSLVITRVALDNPQLDLDALLAWQASRPPAEGEFPTLTRGASIRGGTLTYGDWRVDSVQLELDRLERQQPLALKLAGRAATEGVQVEFSSDITIARLTESTSGTLSAAGTAQFTGHQSKFSLAATDCGYHLAPGQPQQRDEVINCGDLMFSGESPLPTLKAFISIGRGRLGHVVEVRTNGWMKDWPDTWPVLPAPLSGEPTQFDLRYWIPSGGEALMEAKLGWGAAKANASFRMDDLLDWLDSGDLALLPPLLGEVSTPTLEVSGATLQGVTIQIEEDAPANATPEP